MELSASMVASIGTAVVAAVVFSYFKLTDKALRAEIEADQSARENALATDQSFWRNAAERLKDDSP